MKLPRVLRCTENELFNFFELMDTENSPNILTGCTSLLTEASWKSWVLDGKIFRLKPFLTIHCWDWLLWCSDQIVLVIWVFTTCGNLYSWLLFKLCRVDHRSQIVEQSHPLWISSWNMVSRWEYTHVSLRIVSRIVIMLGLVTHLVLWGSNLYVQQF